MKPLYEEALGRIRQHYAGSRPGYISWHAWTNSRYIEQWLPLDFCWTLEDLDNQIFLGFRDGQGDILL